MAKQIQVLNQVGGQPVAVFQKAFEVKAGTAGSILPGMLVIADSNAGYVKAAATGCTVSAVVVGVAVSQSSETAAVDGTVLVECAPILFCKMFATTPANLVRTMQYTNRYTLTVSSSDYTMDQGTTTSGLFRLLDFDNTTTGTCLVSFACSLF